MENRATAIAGWLRARAAAAGARGLVLPLGAGLDSAVAARLCQMACPGQVIGVILRDPGDPGAERDRRAVADHFELPTIAIDLQPACDALVDGLRAGMAAIATEQQPPTRLPEADGLAGLPLNGVGPRLRMTALYYLADSLTYLVVGTANRCDLTLGAFTRHGDNGIDLLPLGNVLESEVRRLAVDLGVPAALLEKAAGAAPSVGQGDQEEAGIPYRDLERYLVRGPEGVAPALALRLERIIRSLEHTRGPASSPD